MPTSVHAAVAVALLGCVAAATPGPGRGAWQTANPSKFGLDAAHLKHAAMELHDAAAIRNCTLVVVNGEIVLEAYDSASNALSRFESDSMGKTATAAMVGLLVMKGLADLDTPIRAYGVTDDKAVWNATGVNFFPQLTLRHLISQATGYGRVAPGSFFTYDSDAYIQYISYTIAACTGEEPVAWVTREFAEPLGVGTLWSNEGLPGGHFSAGGGQLYTCRDAARVGQLVTQRGTWKDVDGKPIRLYSEKFAAEFLVPSYPQNNAAYGFLTWTNTNVEKVAPGVHCCAPRWGHAAYVCASHNPDSDCSQCCATRAANGTDEVAPVAGKMCNLNSTTLNERDADISVLPGQPRDQWMYRVGSARIEKQMIGDNQPGTTPAPDDMGVAMGLYARYIIMAPSINLTVISIGSAEGWAESCWGGYDDAYTVGVVWNILAPAVTPKAVPAANMKYLSDIDARNKLAKKFDGRLTFVSPAPAARRQLQPRAVKAVSKAKPVPAKADTKWAGSCTCYCHAESGRGRCLNVAMAAAPTSYGPDPGPGGFDGTTCGNIPNIMDKTNKKSFMFQQNRYCSPLGTPKQCRYPADKDKDICSGGATALKGGRHSSGTTVQARACAPVAGQNVLATANCITTYDTWDGCYWRNDTCSEAGKVAPWFPPADDYYGEK